MNQEIKEEWIKDLESGDYTQATGALRKGDGYCCLGVLCEQYKRKHPEVEWESDGGGNYIFLGAGGFLPTQVREWAKIRSTNGAYEIEDQGVCSDLATRNDEGSTFNDIAELIRRHF
jgi:hypothetical protein